MPSVFLPQSGYGIWPSLVFTLARSSVVVSVHSVPLYNCTTRSRLNTSGVNSNTVMCMMYEYIVLASTLSYKGSYTILPPLLLLLVTTTTSSSSAQRSGVCVVRATPIM